MPTKRNFTFPFSLLTQEADYILDAAEAHASDINTRLPAGFVDAQRELLDTVRGADSALKSKTASVGGLTVTQRDALRALNEWVGKAKETAKRAFKGQDVKLRSEFQVGINSPGDLASILERARTVRDACLNADNAAALAAKGWVAADTTQLTNVLDVLDSSDDSQETAKADKKGSTDARNAAANDLYEGLLTIQNAADIQWSESLAANVKVRAEFRLDNFPPRAERKKTSTPSPAPTPPVPPT